MRTVGEDGVFRVSARTGYVILLCYHVAWVCIGAVIITVFRLGLETSSM